MACLMVLTFNPTWEKVAFLCASKGKFSMKFHVYKCPGWCMTELNKASKTTYKMINVVARRIKLWFRGCFLQESDSHLLVGIGAAVEPPNQPNKV